MGHHRKGSKNKGPQTEAMRKAELILKVRSGLMKAEDAARALGISRKTYYKWEKRGLEALLEALCERNSGRPVLAVDEEKEALKRKVAELEKELKLTKGSLRLKPEPKKKE